MDRRMFSIKGSVDAAYWKSGRSDNISQRMVTNSHVILTAESMGFSDQADWLHAVPFRIITHRTKQKLGINILWCCASIDFELIYEWTC